MMIFFLHILKPWFLKMKDLKLFPDVFTHTISFLRQSHVVQDSLKLTIFLLQPLGLRGDRCTTPHLAVFRFLIGFIICANVII